MGKSGVSLIEVLVAIAIMSIVMVGLTTFLTNSISTQNGLSFKAQVESMTNEIRATLGVPAACAYTFNGATPAAVSLTAALDSLRTVIKNSANTTVYTAGATYERTIVLTSMRAGGTIDPTATYVTTSGNEGQFKLTLLFTSLSPTLGNSTLRRTITINTIKDGSNNLTYCYAKAAGADSLWTLVGNNIYYSSGYVGIGTASPTARLEVGDSTQTAGDISTVAVLSGATSYPLTVANTTARAVGNVNRISFDFGASGWSSTGFVGAEIENTGTAATALSFGTYSGGLTEKMRITGAGNVGIAIANPSTSLQIYSNVIPEIASADPLGAFSIKSTASTAMVFGVQASSPYSGHIQMRHGTIAGANYYPLSLQPLGGNVSIGHVAPNFKLDVGNGSDGITIGQAADNSQTIQTYIDGQYANRTTYASGCCNTLYLQPDVGVIGVGSYTSVGAKLQVYNTAAMPALSIGDSTIDNGSAYGMVNLTRPADTTRAHLAFIRAGNYVWQFGYVNGSSTFGIFPWNLGSAGTPNIAFTPGGYVGIGMVTPAYPLDVAGVARAGSFLSTSDEREKEAVRTAPGLEMILDLRGVTFRWKRDHRPGMGVIAQEVERVAPELVATDEGGRKSVNYEGLIAPLIESVKELNVICKMSETQSKELVLRMNAHEKTIAELRFEVESLKRQVSSLNSRLISEVGALRTELMRLSGKRKGSIY